MFVVGYVLLLFYGTRIDADAHGLKQIFVGYRRFETLLSLSVQIWCARISLAHLAD